MQVPGLGKAVIVDTEYTRTEQFPPAVFGGGATVQVMKVEYLASSRPNAIKIPVAVVKLPNGAMDLYPAGNIRNV